MLPRQYVVVLLLENPVLANENLDLGPFGFKVAQLEIRGVRFLIEGVEVLNKPIDFSQGVLELEKFLEGEFEFVALAKLQDHDQELEVYGKLSIPDGETFLVDGAGVMALTHIIHGLLQLEQTIPQRQHNFLPVILIDQLLLLAGFLLLTTFDHEIPLLPLIGIVDFVMEDPLELHNNLVINTMFFNLLFDLPVELVHFGQLADVVHLRLHADLVEDLVYHLVVFLGVFEILGLRRLVSEDCRLEN